MRRIRLAAATVIAAAVAVTMIAVPAASARSVNDPRGDEKCFHDGGSHKPCSDRKMRDADIVRATAGHESTRLRHTIRVVGKVQQVQLMINTDSDPDCERRLFSPVGGGDGITTVRGCGSGHTGRARYDFHRHSVEIFFSKSLIGNPSRYGWIAYTSAGGWRAHAVDGVPNGGGYIPHRLG
jgi:hypothetical protein